MVGGVSGQDIRHVLLPVMLAQKTELGSATIHLQALAVFHAIRSCHQKLYHAILIHARVKKMS